MPSNHVIFKPRMKYSFVTHFDSGFIPQGLSLCASLRRVHPDALLVIVCLDQECHDYLKQTDLENTHLLNLREHESAELLKIKGQRTRAEYYWTLTPWTILWSFQELPHLVNIVYVDADLYFRKSISDVYDSFLLDSSSVLITPHDYAPNYDQSPSSGEYCVQLIAVKRGEGETVIRWWRDRCMEWCFARFENGLYGDQKYLEHFEKVFPGQISILDKKGYIQAPWNASYYPFSLARIYHFHGLRTLSSNRVHLSGYYIPAPTIEFIYKPYLRLLYSAIGSMNASFRPQMSQPRWPYYFFQVVAKRFIHKVLGQTRPPYWSVIKRNTNKIKTF